VTVFSEEHPDAFFSACRDNSQWIDQNALSKAGALVIWKGGAEKRPAWFKSLNLDESEIQAFPSIERPRAVPSLPMSCIKAISGKEPKRDVYSFIICKPRPRQTT